MIFVTIGSLYPFDRFVRAMDQIALSLPGEAFLAQTGDGAYKPANMKHVRMLPRGEFVQVARSAKLIVAHAGMGSVLSALEFAKPIVLFPRRFEQGEHNTDHQMATARWLMQRPGVRVAFDDDELSRAVHGALADGRALEPMPATAPPEFVARIRTYICS